MTMGSRIVVMKDGVIQQVDTPINLYDKPVNRFVGGFMGSPAMNFLVGTVENGSIKGGNFSVGSDSELGGKLNSYNGKKVYMGIRPENLYIKGTPEAPTDTTHVIDATGGSRRATRR